MSRWLLAAALLVTTGCATSGAGHPARARWSTGFWFWHGSALDVVWPGDAVDVLFVLAGTVRQPADAAPQWYARGEWPRALPPAREYWAVFRYEGKGVPGEALAPVLAREVARMRAAAASGKQNFAGVQLDVDSPTAALSQYAAFLRALRKSLPQGSGLSITGLLDWFRPGTAIDEVIAAVDEFVPQFYDAGDREAFEDGGAIGTPVDAARWGPVFARFGKRYRVGISCFGRARIQRGKAESRAEFFGTGIYRGLRPLDVAPNAAFALETKRNSAGELLLHYRAAKETRIGYTSFDSGDSIDFVLPTPEGVRAAVESVRQMKGENAGVVFFRWPTFQESLAMPPGEVLQASESGGKDSGAASRVRLVDGRCVAVECADVYLEAAGALSDRPVRLLVRASAPLEYFLPEPGVPVRMSGPAVLELSLPAYCGRGRIYLGRVVSERKAEFRVEQK